MTSFEVRLLHDDAVGQVTLHEPIRDTDKNAYSVYTGWLTTTPQVDSAKMTKTDDVVVKQVKLGSLAEREQSVVRRIEESRRTGCRLDHVVTCLAVGDHDGCRYFVLEKAAYDAAAAAAALGTNQVARRALARDVLVGTLRALIELSGIGVVNRDLHPGNVLLRTGEGGPDDVLVGDFGHAYCSDAVPRTDGGRHGIRLVQPLEVFARDGGHQGSVDDAYSAAVCAYLLLTADRTLPLADQDGVPLHFVNRDMGKMDVDNVDTVHQDLRILEDVTDPGLKTALRLLLEQDRKTRDSHLGEVGRLLGVKDLESLSVPHTPPPDHQPPDDGSFDVPPPDPEPPEPPAPPEPSSLPPYVARLADFRPSRLNPPGSGRGLRWRWPSRKAAVVAGRVTGSVALLVAALLVVPPVASGAVRQVYQSGVPEAAWDMPGWSLWPQRLTWGLTVAAGLGAAIELIWFLAKPTRGLPDSSPYEKTTSGRAWYRRALVRRSLRAIGAASMVVVLGLGAAAAVVLTAARGSASQPAQPMAQTTVDATIPDCDGTVVRFNQRTGLVCWRLPSSWIEDTQDAYTADSFPTAMNWSAPASGTGYVASPHTLWASLTSTDVPCQSVYAHSFQTTSNEKTHVPGSYVGSTDAWPELDPVVRDGHWLLRAFNHQTYRVLGRFNEDRTQGLEVYQRLVVHRDGLNASARLPHTPETSVFVYILRACSADQVDAADSALASLMEGLTVRDRTVIDPRHITRDTVAMSALLSVNDLGIPVASNVRPLGSYSLDEYGKDALAITAVSFGDTPHNGMAWAVVRVYAGDTIPDLDQSKSGRPSVTSSVNDWVETSPEDADWTFDDVGFTGNMVLYYKNFNVSTGSVTVEVTTFTGATDRANYADALDSFLEKLTVGPPTTQPTSTP